MNENAKKNLCDLAADQRRASTERQREIFRQKPISTERTILEILLPNGRRKIKTSITNIYQTGPGNKGVRKSRIESIEILGAGQRAGSGRLVSGNRPPKSTKT